MQAAFAHAPPAPPTAAGLLAAHTLAGLRFETRASDDVDQHAGHLSSWRQRYDQTSRGRFAGRVRELWLDGPRLQVFHEYTGPQTSQQCEPWAGAVWFGVPAGDASEPLRFCGREQAWGTRRPVLRAAADAGFSLHTPRDFGIYGVAVDEAWWRAQLDRLGLPAPTAPVGARGVAPAVHRALCEAIEALLCLAADGNGEHAGMQATLPSAIDRLLGLLSGDEDASAAMAWGRSRRPWQVVMAARELVSRPTHPTMTVDDVCARLHVTRRTLQNYFQRVVGESPAEFLKAVRLNACRRGLREAASAAATVQDVAFRWGFFHMGHFAADYKAMFGEPPSHTLRGARSAAQRG